MAALRDFDAVETALSNVASVGSLFSEVHPLEEVRSAGEAAIQEVQRLSTELSLDRELYEVFAGLEATGLDADAIRLLEKVRRDFRRAGVDQDDATRARITAINERLVLVGQSSARTSATTCAASGSGPSSSTGSRRTGSTPIRPARTAWSP